jgi:hypothetical protein
LRRSFPRSRRIITEVAVATGFVSEAMSKSESRGIGSSRGQIEREPAALA